MLDVAGLTVNIATGDFDGNGDPDIAVSQFGPNQLTIFFNTGGNLSAAVDFPLGTLRPTKMGVANIDSQSGDDIVILGEANDAVTLGTLRPNATSTSTPITLAPENSEQIYTFVATGSVNQDGIYDVAFLAEKRLDQQGSDIFPEFAVLKNDGTGTFVPYYSEVVGVDATTLALEDLSVDGYADVVIGKYFWKHSYTADTYAEGRVTLATNVNPKKVLFTNLNLDDAKELVIAESLKFLVLTPSCP